MKTVLVIDDDPLVSEAVADVLTELQLQVVTRANGAEALEWLQT
jgi:CheY-like chemotaxis protein